MKNKNCKICQAVDDLAPSMSYCSVHCYSNEKKMISQPDDMDKNKFVKIKPNSSYTAELIVTGRSKGKPVIEPDDMEKRKNKEIKIRHRKDDCHYETSFEYADRGGYVPFVIEYGFTQTEADTKAFEKLRSLAFKEGEDRIKKIKVYIKLRIGQCGVPITQSCEYCSALYDVINYIEQKIEVSLHQSTREK